MAQGTIDVFRFPGAGPFLFSIGTRGGAPLSFPATSAPLSVAAMAAGPTKSIGSGPTSTVHAPPSPIAIGATYVVSTLVATGVDETTGADANAGVATGFS